VIMANSARSNRTDQFLMMIPRQVFLNKLLR